MHKIHSKQKPERNYSNKQKQHQTTLTLTRLSKQM